MAAKLLAMRWAVVSRKVSLVSMSLAKASGSSAIPAAACSP